MGLLGSILGSVAESISESVKDSSDSKYIDELRPKMMNSAIANDFEAWFRAQLETKPFLYSQHNFYDSCERIVGVDDDGVFIFFEIEKADYRDEVSCNFATTLGYMPLSANGLMYSNGKPATERVLIKTFAEVVKEKIKNVLDQCQGDFNFGFIEYDDGTDKNGSYMDRITQRAEAAAWGESAKLEQIAGFRYNVPKQAQRSAF